MKKTTFLMASLSAMFMLCACGGAANKAEAAATEQPETTETTAAEAPAAKESVTYQNKDFKYSVQLPAGFEQQNDDAEMEASRGGKLFLRDGCMIDVTARKMDYTYIKAEESIKQSAEFAASAYEGDENGKLLSKDIQPDHFLVKGLDEFGLRANYEMQKNGVSVIIHVTYPQDQEAAFNKEVDQVVQSLVVE